MAFITWTSNSEVFSNSPHLIITDKEVLRNSIILFIVLSMAAKNVRDTTNIVLHFRTYEEMKPFHQP